MKKEIKAQELTDPEIEDLDLEIDSIPDAEADDDDMDSAPSSEKSAAVSGRRPHI